MISVAAVDLLAMSPTYALKKFMDEASQASLGLQL